MLRIISFLSVLFTSFSFSNFLKADEPNYLVFVSFSMNETSLISLTRDAKENGGVVVLKGFIDNDFVKTQEAIVKIAKKSGQGMSVDPVTFAKYEVTKVPTFIKTNVDGSYEKLSGNVTTKFALERLRKGAKK